VCLAAPPTGPPPPALLKAIAAYTSGPNSGAPIVDPRLFAHYVEAKNKQPVGKVWPVALGAVCCNNIAGFCGFCAWISDGAAAPGKAAQIVMGCTPHS